MPTATLATPIGTILVEAAGDRLTAIRIGGGEATIDRPDHPVLADAVEQLRDYFAGRRDAFDLPLAAPRTTRGGALRAAIASVPHGETLSYGALAQRIGSSARAMGQACARNPFPIVVPCHRVLSADPAQENYSAGAGVATKRWLLDHERHKERADG